MNRPRLLIADDHTMFSAALQKLLETQYEVVGCVEDGRALLRAAVRLRPDVVLVDIGMPLLNGLDAGRELKKLLPNLKIVFLTMSPDIDVAGEALRMGASGYLLKTSRGEELSEAIRKALQGVSYVTPRMHDAIEQGFIRDPNFLDHQRHLTDRQREILQMLAEGHSMKEIAHLLRISIRTVRFHKYKIREDLGITNDADLVRYAIKHSLTPPP